VAAHATEAYALLAHEYYELILIHIGLPDGDGFEVRPMALASRRSRTPWALDMSRLACEILAA
jgi:DNA-binding response OmpR family regulator